MDNAELYQLSGKVGAALKAHQMMLATAESCTGGWVGEVLTFTPGSSHWYDRGFITYTNEAKREVLGVSAQTLLRYGAVSEQAVREMAAGALRHSHAQVALAISGIAGPGGAVPGKPVGTVCLAWEMTDGYISSETRHFSGNRQKVRAAAVKAALEGILRCLGRLSSR